jgi:chromosome partitioning protein
MPARRRRRDGDLRVREPEGGVGKTTVTLGLAAALARRSVSALLIDLDPQASATKVLGVELEERHTVADVLLEQERFSLRDVVVRTAWGFDVAPAETALAPRESRRATADEFILRWQLADVVGYDVALVDCPPSLGLLTLNALTAASHLIVVTEASFLALQGTDELLETLELVRTHYNRQLELAGVIVNRIERTVEHRDSVLEIERYYGADLLWQPLLPKRAVAQDATRRGVPIGEFARRPARELAGAFASLARRMEVARVAA